jgi:hypothetical protein
LAAFKGSLHLDGLETLSVDVARELAARKHGTLSIDGLKKLDVATAQALAPFRGQYLWMRGVTTLDAETAKALAAFQGHELHVGRPPEPRVRRLGRRGGVLRVVACGARCGGGSDVRELHLDALAALDGDTARVLVGFDGTLHLAGLAALDADAARTLAASTHWTGSLPGLTAFESPDSVAVAAALAARAGGLALPNLEKISPKTLTALIGKEDIEIPLIETLELIPEPDGSPADDFVIPEWLDERQERQRAAQAAE